MELAAGWSLTMPGNYIVLYPPVPVAAQRAMLRQAHARLKSIVRAVRRRERHAPEDSPGPLRWLGGRIYALAAPRLAGRDRKFAVTDTCTGCGLCSELCPVGNIRLTGGRPVWLGRCQQCMACIQWCPTEAIQAGGVTRERRRYHHPEVAARELVARET